MRAFAIAALALGLLTATPALANWQWTRWGMTPEEVVAASGGKAAPGPNGTLSMPGPYDLGGLAFDEVTFVFREGRLSSVTLGSADDSEYQQADWALSAAFGQPVSVEASDHPSKVFVDRPSGNAIRLSGGIGTVVVYSPIPTGF